DQTTPPRHGPLFDGPVQPLSERSAPREPLVDAVPVADLVLAELPAEQDLLPVTARRKVEQPFLERLDLCTGRVDLLRARSNRVGFLLDRLGELTQITRLHVAAVACDPRHELALL